MASKPATLATRCPKCGDHTGIATLPVSSIVAGTKSACARCGFAPTVSNGTLVLAPAPEDWGYTKWNKIQRVSEQAWSDGWETAAGGNAWLTWAGRAMPLLACGWPKGAKVLDVGSGPGAMLIGMAAAGNHVTGLDASQQLLSFCAARAHQMGLGERVSLVCSDFAGYQSTPEVFDAVVMNGFLEWLPEFESDNSGRPVEIQAAGVAKAAKWLKPGGMLVIGLENRYGLKYLLGGIDDHTDMRFTSVAPRWLGNWMYRRKHGKPFRCHTPSLGDIHRWAAGAGLSVETVLSPLPTYREPRACIRADDAEGAAMIARTNRKWISGAPLRHRIMAQAARSSAPILSILPTLGRFLTNYFLVTLRKPGPVGEPAFSMDWASTVPPRLLRNQHLGSFQSGDELIRISLGDQRASKEGEVQAKLAKSLPQSLQRHINPPTRVSAGPGLGLARYQRIAANSHAEQGVLASDLMELLRAISELPAGDMERSSGLKSLYLLGEQGASHLTDDICNAAREFLPLDRVMHGDLTKDNLIFGAPGGFVLVDWEAAGAGHPWLDWCRWLAASECPPRAERLSELQNWVRKLPQHDQWTLQLFGETLPEPVVVLVTGFLLVCDDTKGLKALRTTGKPVIQQLLSKSLSV